jgi:prophage antirepressor-like protein|nr:MAG TPA: repressor domain protein [Bacteriophage sp.]
MDDKSIISSSWLYYKQYFVVKPMNIPATKEEILENFKKNNNGRPLNKDDYEVAEALSRITYKAYEVGMEDAKQMNMEDMMDNKRCNALHVFKSKSFGQLRTIEENGKILFCASDVAKALGYINPRDAISRHCRGVVKRDAPTQGGIQAIAFIPEGDVYRLITHSKLPGAEKFESWVFDDVLPSLRKDGYYSLAPQENKPDAQNDAILQVLMKNTEVLQVIVQQNQQIMIALTNLSVNDAKRTMEIQPYTSHQGKKGDGKRSKRITILMSDSERTFVTREARKHGFTAGEYIYNLSVAASKDQIDLG